MDEPPRPVNRRLPLLGAALIVGGIVGLCVEPWWFAYIPQIGLCLVVILAGLSALWLSRRETSVGTATLFLWSGLLAISVVLVFGFVEMFQQMSNLKSYGFFAIIQTLLMILGAPVLWGAAFDGFPRARIADAFRPQELPAAGTGIRLALLGPADGGHRTGTLTLVSALISVTLVSATLVSTARSFPLI